MNFFKLITKYIISRLSIKKNGNPRANDSNTFLNNDNEINIDSNTHEKIDNYKFEKTKALIHREIDKDNPAEEMGNLLEAVIELLNYPGNDFCWSSWENADSAVEEIESLLKKIRNNIIPNKIEISILFAPTGPLQEVSLSSGWGDGFLKIAEKYDQIERIIWRY